MRKRNQRLWTSARRFSGLDKPPMSHGIIVHLIFKEASCHGIAIARYAGDQRIVQGEFASCVNVTWKVAGGCS